MPILSRRAAGLSHLAGNRWKRCDERMGKASSDSDEGMQGMALPLRDDGGIAELLHPLGIRGLWSVIPRAPTLSSEGG